MSTYWNPSIFKFSAARQYFHKTANWLGYNKSVSPTLRFQQLQNAHQEARSFNYQLAQVQDQEREELAYLLHDGVLQSLIFIARHTTFCLDLAGQEKVLSAKFNEQMQSLQKVSQSCIQELRDICLGLYPIAVDTVGLASALHWLAEDTNGQSANLEVSVIIKGLNLDERLPRPVEYSLFIIAREALNNTIKHANARHCWIILDSTPGELLFEVRDDGQGISSLPNLAQFARQGHLGLAGLRIRVERLGGQFKLETRPGCGTTVRVGLNCQKLPASGYFEDRPANSPQLVS